MKELNQVVSKRLANKMSVVIDRECNWCFDNVFAEKALYGYLVVTVDDDFRDHDCGDWNGSFPEALGEVFAFDRKGNLLGLQAWWSEGSDASAIDEAIDSAGAALERDLLVAHLKMIGARIENGEACIGIDTFELLFKPEQNHLTEESSFDGWMFETYGQDAEYVEWIVQDAPGRVWTILDGEEMVIVSGMRWVNRLGYLVTEHPKTDGLDFFVSLD